MMQATLKQAALNQAEIHCPKIEPRAEAGDSVLAQFNQLIEDVLAGTLQRTVFSTWEIAILVDMVSCNLRQSSRREIILRQYRFAMQEYLRKGARIPLKLSDYLQTSF